MYRNVENMIVVPITKRMEIIMSIQVSPNSRMNFNCKEMVERKGFLANPNNQRRVSEYGEHDCSANKKRMEIITSILD